MMKEDRMLLEEVEYITDLSEEELLDVSGGGWFGYLMDSLAIWNRFNHDMDIDMDDYQYYGH